MKGEKNKDIHINNSDSIYSESVKKAVATDIVRGIQKEMRRQKAIREEINYYTGGKQIVLTIKREIKTS